MFPQSHRSWGWRIVRKLEPFSIVSSKQSSFRAHLPSMVSRACFSGCSLIQGWGLFDQNTTWSNYQCWKHHGKGSYISYTGPKHLCWKHLNQTLFCLLRLLMHDFDPPDHAWPPTASDAQAKKRFGLRNSLHHFDHLQVSLPRQFVEKKIERSPRKIITASLQILPKSLDSLADTDSSQLSTTPDDFTCTETMSLATSAADGNWSLSKQSKVPMKNATQNHMEAAQVDQASRFCNRWHSHNA